MATYRIRRKFMALPAICLGLLIGVVPSTHAQGVFAGVYIGTFIGPGDDGDFALFVRGDNTASVWTFDQIDEEGTGRDIVVGSNGSISFTSALGDVLDGTIAGDTLSGTFSNDDGIGMFMATRSPNEGALAPGGGIYTGSFNGNAFSGGTDIGDVSGVLELLVGADGSAFAFSGLSGVIQGDLITGQTGGRVIVAADGGISGTLLDGIVLSGSLDLAAFTSSGTFDATEDGVSLSGTFALSRLEPLPPPPPLLLSSVLPASRSVQVSAAPATSFATIINAGGTTATDCSIAPVTTVPATFGYVATNSATNEVEGPLNTPVDIPADGSQSFIFSFAPTEAFLSIDLALSFDCTNSEPAASINGLNTLLLAASDAPVADIVALAATAPTAGVVTLPAASGAGAFAVASVNVGETATISVSADTGAASLPLDISLCRTDPTGQCVQPSAPTPDPIELEFASGETPTFSIFVTETGDDIAFNPANNRVFVRFLEGTVSRGATSVAVQSLN